VFGVPKVTNETKITLLGYEEDLDWGTLSTGELVVTVPRQQDLPDGAEWGLTLKLRYLADSTPETGKMIVPKKTKYRRPKLTLKDYLLGRWLKSVFPEF